MKNFIVLLIVFFLVSCAKEDLHGPFQLKNGQEVILLVDHRYAATDENLLRLPNLEDVGASSLAGFNDREPGYTYRVKAKFHFEKHPPEDSPSSWFDFVNIQSKEQYKGNEAFEIDLIESRFFGAPMIKVNKEVNDYYFSPREIQLTSASDTIGMQVEEIWQHAKEIRESTIGQRPKWTSIKATVIHDPQKFGKAYLVQKIKFVL